MASKPKAPKHADAPHAHRATDAHTTKHVAPDAKAAPPADPGKAAFERLEARIRATPAERVVAVDANTTAVALLGMSQRLTAPEPYAALSALSAIPYAGRTVFDMRAVDELADVAHALRYARRLASQALAARSKARLPASLVSRIKSLEKTMQKVCEGTLEGIEEVQAELRALSRGTGYDDDIGDLDGYADLYDRYPDRVKLDQLRFDAGQPAAARALAAEALTALAAPLDDADRQALALYQQTWALALLDYGACQRVALVLANGDPAAAADYPSLRSVSHAPPTKTAKSDGGTAPQDGTAEPTAQTR